MEKSLGDFFTLPFSILGGREMVFLRKGVVEVAYRVESAVDGDASHRFIRSL